MRIVVLGLLWACGPSANITVESSESSTSTTSTSETLQWTASGPVVCERPELRASAPFTRFTAGDWGNQDWTDSRDTLLQGGGLAVADFDGDGLLDVFLPQAGDAQLFLSQQGALLRHASDRLPDGLDRAVGATAADMDGDGDLDLFLTRMDAVNLVLRNDGQGTFAAAPVDLHPYRSVSSAFADADADGDLDVVVANYGAPAVANDVDTNQRFENLDGGNLREVPLADALSRGHSLGALWQDLTGDGQADLYVANDFGWIHANQLGLNDGGDLIVDGMRGVNLVLNAMGIAVGELNGDGLPDLLVTGWGELALVLSSSEEGLWIDSTAVAGLTTPPRSEVAWGAEFGDLDNDGDEDLYVAFGWLDGTFEDDTPAREDQSDAIYLQRNDGTFHEVGASWGVDVPGIGRGLVLADLDGNGFLDVIKRDKAGPAQIWLARCDDAAWLVVDLRQPGANPFAIGAEIRVWTGDRVQTRWLRAGGTSLASSGPPEVHIGLGDHETVDRIEVVWPDGEVSEIPAVPTRQRVRLSRAH